MSLTEGRGFPVTCFFDSCPTPPLLPLLKRRMTYSGSCNWGHGSVDKMLAAEGPELGISTELGNLHSWSGS